MKKTMTISTDHLLQEVNTLPYVTGYGHITCQCIPKNQNFDFVLKYGKMYDNNNVTTWFNLKRLISTYNDAIKRGDVGKIHLSNEQFKWEIIFKKGDVIIYKTKLY